MTTLLHCLSIAAAVLAQTAAAQTANHRGLPGRLYEAEDWTAPHDGWLTNQTSQTKWRLWTTEGKGKRSRDASLTSPVIKADRATPEDGAPVLHTHITGIARGLYRAWLGGTTRPLAYSLDGGKTWLKSASGETDLGIHDIKDGAFDLWVDDRYANPGNIGPAYYDYIRLAAFAPPKITGLKPFILPDGATQISWITDEPVPAATVECAGRDYPESEDQMRNHRVLLTGLDAGQTFTARVRVGPWRSASVRFVAGRPPAIRKSQPQTIELTVAEPTGKPRRNWPVTSGVPFAKGTLASANDTQLLDAAGKVVPAQFEATAFWPDGSVKWLLVSFCTDTAKEPMKVRLRIGRGAEAPPTFHAIAVHEDAEIVIVKNGPLSLRVGKEKFTLFDGLPAIGDAKGGNGRIVDASGKAYYVGKPDSVLIEERGPVRAVVRAEGDFAADDGARLFRWRARYFVHAGQPWMRLNWTIGNNITNSILTNLQSAAVRVPIAARGPLRASFNNGTPFPIKDDESTWLLQDKDDRFTQSSNGQETTGEHAAGCASVSDGQRTLSVVVKDFWQTYPKGIAIRPDGLHVRVLPPLPRDAFARESQNVEDLIRLYYCYENGQYRIKRGMEFTTDIYVRCAEGPAEPADADWFNHPLVAVAPPQHYCDSGVFGMVEPRRAGVFDGYEKIVEDGLKTLEDNRRQKREYGWMNYGDWHGERHFNWGNHEYDMMGALALQFARTSDPKWLQWAEQAARHSTTIDTVHFPWQARMPGRVYAHSVGHVGGFFDMADPRFRKLGNVFGLRDVSRPNPFVSGAIDPGGHIFQPGNFIVGFLTGERRYREVAEMVCAAQAGYMTANFRFGIERAAGWPLLNAVAAYESTGNPFFLNAARLYAEKIIRTQTARGDWNLPHGPPECMHTPTHPGGKAFAAGILLHGMMMFDRVAPSREAKQCIVRNARWLEKYSWNRGTRSFRYIDTCPTFDAGRGNGATDFLVSSGLAYACTLDRDPALKALLLDSLGRAVRSSARVGKDYIMTIRQTPHALAMLRRSFGISALPPPAK